MIRAAAAWWDPAAQPDQPMFGPFCTPTRARAALWAIAVGGLLCGVEPQASLAAEPFSSPPADLPEFPLSLTDAVNIALRQSPRMQAAHKELEATQGLAIETRAIAIPKLGVSGNYTALQDSAVDSPPPVAGFEFTFGTDQSWRTQVQLVQSIYEGGRLLSSIRAARLLKERSVMDYQVALADLVLDVQLAYHAVLLGEQQIRVQEASIELLTRELKDSERRYEAGTVPRFNVLRAEVELAGARPALSRARNNSRIARNHLANLLGLNVSPDDSQDIPLRLSGQLEADPWPIELPQAIALALKQRLELESLRLTQSLRREEWRGAQGGYKPSLQAFAGYDAHNSMFSDQLRDEVHGWMAGVRLSWDLFDGGRTVGKVQQARARYERAGIELEDAGRRIQLEVRTAYSTFTEAAEVLESQLKVQEQAQEALRLASARSEAGTGTQLDVLAAQTALTDARTTLVRARFEYANARARLERAVGLNLLRGDGSAANPEP